MELREQSLFFEEELTKYTVPALNDEFLKYSEQIILTLYLQKVTKIDSAGVAFIDEMVTKLGLDPNNSLLMNEMVEIAYSTFTSAEIQSVKAENKLDFFT
ncbi:MAG: hypothetical protein J7K29_03545, partial [Candidatus Cloacimonetes bacterium]|nr:hypothetical protein [Candidatus Cloacimonadota bacterium]